MGGIGLSCNTTSTGYTRTHTCTQYAHNMHTHNTQIQDTHIHLNNTEYRYNNHAAHRTEQYRIQRTTHRNKHRIQNTQNRTTPVQHRTSTQNTAQTI